MRAPEEGGAREFLAEAEEILESLGQDLQRLEASAAEGDPDPEVINSIFRGAHSLKGISGMFGLSQVTEVSHKTETLLDALRMGRVPCSRSVLDLLFESLDLLRSLCDRLSSGESPEAARVPAFVERLMEAAEGRAGNGKTSETVLGAFGLPAESVQVLTEYEIHRIRETLRDPKRTLFRVRATFPLETFDTDLEALNERLKACGEIISTLPAPASDTVAEDQLIFDLVVGSKSGLEEVAAAAAAIGAKVEVLEADLPAGVPGAPPPPALGGYPDVASGPADLPESTASGRGLEGELRSLTQTVRVDLPKLDTLMNLVGELVITKGRIQMVSDRLRHRLGLSGEVLDLSKAQKDLERKLSELRAAVMEVRMVPMGQLFSKLHRVLRKILQTSGKEVDLEIVGAETELDKLIVEDLSDPLIHVLRNAVDHGIEASELRTARGKAARGRIRIEARQRGSHVVISVSDDGAGMSAERIRRKAVEKGLIGEEDSLDERELFDLVFVPGFSTRDEVTELSGRGVGMDVLRKNIAALSGMIELRSELGKGTTVTIILPITLAIIQALLVRAAGQTYAIPLNSVLETLALEQEMSHALEGRPMLRLRDTTMPLVRVDALLNERDGERRATYAVVVGAAEKRVALGVDELVSQQDIVIKSLGRRLSGLRGLAGATDLGDQKTILVLDVASLVDGVFAVPRPEG